MNTQEIYNEIMNLPEIISYITKDPFRYEIAQYNDRWGIPVDTCIIATRSINPRFMKYDHDILEVSVKKSEHANSYKITIPFPLFFIYENESLDEKMPRFFTGTHSITYTYLNDSPPRFFIPKEKEKEAIFNFELYNYFETIINEEPRKRIIKFLDYVIHHPQTNSSLNNLPEYMSYMEYLTPKIIKLKDEYGMPLSFKEYAWKI